MMKVNEIAKAAEVSKDTVRHYLRLGLLKATKDPDNGYQLFSPSQLPRLRFIKLAQQLGFKLSDIQQIFADAEKGASPCPKVRDILAERIAESEQKIIELQQLHARMQQALVAWQTLPDSVPDGHSICELIESQSNESEQGSQ